MGSLDFTSFQADEPVELVFLGTGTSSTLPHVDCLTAPPDAKPCRTCLSTLRPEGKHNIRVCPPHPYSDAVVLTRCTAKYVSRPPDPWARRREEVRRHRSDVARMFAEILAHPQDYRDRRRKEFPARRDRMVPEVRAEAHRRGLDNARTC